MLNIASAGKIIKDLCCQNILAQEDGYGPFSAAIVDDNGNVLEIAHNSVVIDNSSVSHAEVNAIKQIQKKFNTYNLSEYNLSICIIIIIRLIYIFIKFNCTTVN